MPSPSWVQGRLAAEPAWSRFLYNTILKRSSTYMTAVMITATTVGIGYDYMIVGFWNSHNKGVRACSALELLAAWQTMTAHCKLPLLRLRQFRRPYCRICGISPLSSRPSVCMCVLTRVASPHSVRAEIVEGHQEQLQGGVSGLQSLSPWEGGGGPYCSGAEQRRTTRARRAASQAAPV